jgi:replicative DNA helicase
MLGRSVLVFARAGKKDDMSYVVAAQLNRGLEDRDDRRPQMHDVRDSGALEERCKLMIGLYRGHAYGGEPQRNVDYYCNVCDQSKRDCLHAPDDEAWSRQMQALILKNSNGPEGTVFMHWDAPTVAVW